jgi:hypothetical protein
VPSSLVVPTGSYSNYNTADAGENVGRASQNESDGVIESQTSDHSGEKVVEATGTKVHVLHEG